MKLLTLIWSLFGMCYGAKILFISPSLSSSLLIQTGRMADLLVQAGHDVTFWIPELISGNRKQIGSKLSKIMRMNDIDDSFEKVVAVYANVSDDNFDMLKNRIDAYNGLLKWCEAILTRKKELEPLKNYGFDMAFTDMIDLCGIGLTKYLGIQTHIWISTGPLHDAFSYNLGIPTPLSYVQVVEDNNARPNMTFWERANNLYQYLISIYVHRDNTAKLNSLFKKKISPTFPDLHELAMQTALCFVNSEEFIEVARPILHKVIYIGGLGIDKPNPIEEPLKSIMEKAKKGVVLVSLGSITSTATLNYNKKKALYKTFARYKDYVFIIKVSLDDKASERIANNISNIKLFNWVPQPDLLGDPRLKLFITHAGANSLIESAIRGVPVITMPLFFDQFRNAYAAEYKKFAYVLPKEEITEETVDRAIKEVLTNPIYKKSATRLATLYANKPFTPEETLVKWVNFVAKHGNLTELIPEGAKLNFVQYFCLDVLLMAFICIIATIYLIFKLFRRFIFYFVYSLKEKRE